MRITDSLISAFDARRPLSRRRAIQGLVGAAVGSALGPVAAGAAQHDAVLDKLTAFRKLRFALHEDPVFWWLRATKYGLVDSRLTPLHGMEIASIFRAKNLGPQRFRVTSLEFVYTTDATTGELLDSLKNPYTGEQLPINDVPVGPTVVEYSPDGPTLPTQLPGSKMDITHSLSAEREGDRIWIRDDTSAVVTAVQGDRPPFIVSDMPTYLGRLADVNDPKNLSPAATVTFQAVSSWQVRMKMGDAPGSMLTRGAGAKVVSFGGLPKRFRDFMREKHPDLFADPVEALNKEPFQFER